MFRSLHLSNLWQRYLRAQRKSKHFLSDCIALGCSVVVFILRVVHRDTILCELSILGVGVRNITALGNLISWQKVDYDFNYHQMEFPCNINVLITSEGRSLLPVRTSGLSLFSVLLLKYYPHVFGWIRETGVLISNRWKWLCWMPLPWELVPSGSCKDSLIFPLQSTGLSSAPWLGSNRGFAVMLTVCGMCCAIPVRQLSSCHGATLPQGH